jgi:hypothetical protein
MMWIFQFLAVFFVLVAAIGLIRGRTRRGGADMQAEDDDSALRLAS